ncbi:hypothetical protein, partial [Dietzia sp. SYD-A1]
SDRIAGARRSHLSADRVMTAGTGRRMFQLITWRHGSRTRPMSDDGSGGAAWATPGSCGAIVRSSNPERVVDAQSIGEADVVPMPLPPAVQDLRECALLRLRVPGGLW